MFHFALKEGRTVNVVANGSILPLPQKGKSYEAAGLRTSPVLSFHLVERGWWVRTHHSDYLFLDVSEEELLGKPEEDDEENPTTIVAHQDVR